MVCLLVIFHCQIPEYRGQNEKGVNYKEKMYIFLFKTPHIDSSECGLITLAWSYSNILYKNIYMSVWVTHTHI